MASTIHAKTSRFQRIFTWRMSNAATPASRIVFTRPTSTADARNPVTRLVERAHREPPSASINAPTTRARFACRGSKRERGGGGVRASGGNSTTSPDDVRPPRLAPPRSIRRQRFTPAPPGCQAPAPDPRPRRPRLRARGPRARRRCRRAPRARARRRVRARQGERSQSWSLASVMLARASSATASARIGPRLPLASTARKERPPGGGSRPSEIREQEEHDRPVAGPRTLLHLARVQRDDATSERPLELVLALAHSRTGFGVRPEHDLDSTPSATLGTADH